MDRRTTGAPRMLRTYHDFEIIIQAGQTPTFLINVHGPGGDAQGTLRLPADPDFQALMQRLAALDTDETVLTQLGQRLFEALFVDQILTVYRTSQAGLGPEEGLRIRLAIGAAEQHLGALPWELLYDPVQGAPLALLDAPIVRYLQYPSRIPTLKTELPLHILLTGAQTPPTTSIQRELSQIRTALSKAE